MASLGQLFSTLPKLCRHGGRYGRFTRDAMTRASVAVDREYTSDVSPSEICRIGCASGFWGDSAVAAPQLIHKGKLDFLVFDYLSEITMSLLTAAKQKMPEYGYAPDFVQASIGPHMKAIKSQGLKVISNAGGINPHACAKALEAAAKKSGIEFNIAVVTGDDLMPQKSDLVRSGVTEMGTGEHLPKTTTSMTSYLGAGAIKQALDMGADIVVTGRCTDSALALGPLMHRFNWKPDEFNLLASGSLAGHLIECGAQSTGGIFTDWESVPEWENIGFPIVEVSKDGKFLLTKPAGTGGIVSPATASEQLVYEIGDPQNYILPDVICDFSRVQFTVIPGREGDAVFVQGAKGKAPTNTYKVSATYPDGYRLTAVCIIGGPKSAAKGHKTLEAVLKRVRAAFKLMGIDDFGKVHVQMLGAEESYGANATIGDGPREAVAWMAVTHHDKKALQLLAREIAPAGTGMAPGLANIVGGRPKVSPILKLFSFLHPKDSFQIDIHMNGAVEKYIPSDVPTVDIPEENNHDNNSKELESGDHTYRLGDLAYTRSGDKGNHCNIGVIARHPSYVPYLRQALTEEAVHKYMEHVFEDKSASVKDLVQRFELPGINGFNFMLYNSLGGGGIASLRPDPQGKTYGQMILDFKIRDVPNLVQKSHQAVNTN